MRQKLTEYEKYANQVVINSPVEWKVSSVDHRMVS